MPEMREKTSYYRLGRLYGVDYKAIRHNTRALVKMMLDSTDEWLEELYGIDDGCGNDCWNGATQFNRNGLHRRRNRQGL